MGVRIPPFGPIGFIKMKMRKCKHCSVEFDIETKPLGWMANHSRWCSLNPKREQYAKTNHLHGIMAMKSKESRKKAAIGIQEAWKKGCYENVNFKTFLGKKHTEETKEKLRHKALQSKHRRLLRSTRKYHHKDGTVVLLDSSWEETLAKRLDELNVDWIRPKEPIEWCDKNGIKHNYFPDFYLPNQNIFLDPKNNIVYTKTIEKIKVLEKTIPNLIILRSLKQCEEYVPT